MNHILKRVVTVDVETTIKNKGHPFTSGNKLVTIQIKIDNEPTKVFWRDSFRDCLEILYSASCIVATNSKFDLHWLRRELGFTAKCVWDLQIAEFLFSNQLWIYPDLETMSTNYGFGHKIDNIKLNYWDKGIDTDKIPPEELEEYGIQDIDLTYQIFLKQLEKFQGPEQDKFLLFRVQCNDLLVLQDMEWNGIYYDKLGSLEAAEKLNKHIESIDNELTQFIGGIPLNFNSRDDISCLLYGGEIKHTTKLPIGVFKTGTKLGQPRYKIIKTRYELPRRVDPIKGSELKKEGFYATDAETLVSLKPDKSGRFIISKLLERAKIKKLQSTYLTGFPKIIEEMEWENNIIHSNLNQCSVVSGRLSSTKPNQQNMAKECKRYCISRYYSI